MTTSKGQVGKGGRARKKRCNQRISSAYRRFPGSCIIHSSPDVTTTLPFRYLACVLALHMVCVYRLLRESRCTPQKENHALPAESTYFGFTSYSARWAFEWISSAKFLSVWHLDGFGVDLSSPFKHSQRFWRELTLESVKGAVSSQWYCGYHQKKIQIKFSSIALSFSQSCKDKN